MRRLFLSLALMLAAWPCWAGAPDLIFTDPTTPPPAPSPVPNPPGPTSVGAGQIYVVNSLSGGIDRLTVSPANVFAKKKFTTPVSLPAWLTPSGGDGFKEFAGQTYVFAPTKDAAAGSKVQILVWLKGSTNEDPDLVHELVVGSGATPAPSPGPSPKPAPAISADNLYVYAILGGSPTTGQGQVLGDLAFWQGFKKWRHLSSSDPQAVGAGYADAVKSVQLPALLLMARGANGLSVISASTLPDNEQAVKDAVAKAMGGANATVR